LEQKPGAGLQAVETGGKPPVRSAKRFTGPHFDFLMKKL
jgi:hypothetical protein